jgi:hypothetical protein
MEYAIIIILIVAQGVREYFVQKERASLLDRIMSKTYTEFKDNEHPEPNHLEDEDDGTEDLESAKGVILDEEKE